MDGRDAAGDPTGRSSAEVLDPVDMGGARSTRHSFARTLVRRASHRGWRVRREVFDIDGQGRGTAVYRIDAEGRVWSFVAFSQTLPEDARTDRVVAEAWDVTAALVEGEVDDRRLGSLRAEVTRQESGRADTTTVIWTRANRSARFFDYVVDRLASGRQPEASVLGSAAYVLRSTAFYSNGKFGLADFERFTDDHPFAVPYRAHMLCAWLLRELSYDLVEWCAALRSRDAVRLAGGWRRYLGLGNATGLGMVPYVVNHPQVLDSWARLREVPLARVCRRSVRRDDADVPRVVTLLDRARQYLAERGDLDTAPYLDGPALAGQVAEVSRLVEEFGRDGTMGTTTDQSALGRPAHGRRIARSGVQGVVASVLVELSCELDDEVEAGLRRDETTTLLPAMTCGDLLALVRRDYDWTRAFDFAHPSQHHHFWFSSSNNEEPRRAVRSVDPGENVAHAVDVARSVHLLRGELEAVPADLSVAELLARRPRLRAAVVRVQTAGALHYGEVRANLASETFLPLHVQRFQLAVYGMDNFSPQSTDWLRVSLFSGAPRTADLDAGTADDDWIFTLKPFERTRDAALA